MRGERGRGRGRGRGRRREREGDDRAQLSLTLVEAAVGALFVLGVAAAFSLSPGPAVASGEAQLDAYADDALTVLAGDPPAADPTATDAVPGDSRLAAAGRSAATFERERVGLGNRTAAVLPPHVAFRLSTPHGGVGVPPPPGAPTGEASVATASGRVTLRVWYA